MRAEADGVHAIAVFLLLFAKQGTDIDHALCRHVCRAGIANVRVVLPNDRFCVGAVELHQSIQALDHVAVAHVP